MVEDNRTTLGSTLAHGLSKRAIHKSKESVVNAVRHHQVKAGKQKRAAIYRVGVKNLKRFFSGKILFQRTVGGQDGKDKNAAFDMVGWMPRVSCEEVVLEYAGLKARDPMDEVSVTVAVMSNHCLARMYQTFGESTLESLFEKLKVLMVSLIDRWYDHLESDVSPYTFALPHKEGVIVVEWDGTVFNLKTAIALDAMSPIKKGHIQEQLDNGVSTIPWE